MKKVTLLQWITLAVSVGAILIALYRSVNLDWDAIMFAVAMLSGLVVVLIGWNIYSLFDIKQLKNAVDDRIAKFDKKRKEDNDAHTKIQRVLMSQIYDTSNKIYNTHLMMIESKGKKLDDYIYAVLIISSIELHCDMGEIDISNMKIAMLTGKLPSDEIIDSASRRKLIDRLEALRKQYKLIGIEKLIQLIDEWKHKDLT